MGKPIVYNVSTFDAKDTYTFSFSYSGNQPHKNRILILNTITNQTVFDETIDSMKYIHEVICGTLINGVSYSVQISVTDVNGEVSSLSDKFYFICYSSPSFSFNGLDEESQNNLSAGSYTAIVDYSQEQSRQLRNYKFYLYNAGKSLIKESEEFNYTKGDAIQYVYKDLENDNLYYIRATGETIDNVSVDTGYVKLYTSYVVSSVYNAFDATCNEKGGYIYCSTHITSIDAKTDKQYDVVDGTVDLRDGKLEYNDGILISEDCTLAFTVLSVDDNALLYRATNGVNAIEVYNYIYEDKVYYKLQVDNFVEKYILYSELFNKNTHKTIYVKRKNNLYKLSVIEE